MLYSFMTGSMKSIVFAVSTVTAALLMAGCAAISLDSPNWPPMNIPLDQSMDARDVNAVVARSASSSSADSINVAEGWSGHYEGNMPCADCAGVRTMLTLNRDGSYILSISRMDSGALPQLIQGQFIFTDDETEITLDEKGDRRRYAVGWKELRMLNHDGTPVRGVLGEPLTLKKRDS